MCAANYEAGERDREIGVRFLGFEDVVAELQASVYAAPFIQSVTIFCYGCC